MKKGLLLLLLFLCAFGSKLQAQLVIPDANLVAWMQSNGYASVINGNVLDTVAVYSLNYIGDINASNAGIADLTGFEFVLKTWGGVGSLNLSNNQIVKYPGYVLSFVSPPIVRVNVDLSHNLIDSVFFTDTHAEYALNLSNNRIVYLFADSSFNINMSSLVLDSNLLQSLPYLNSTVVTALGFNMSVVNNQLRKQPRGNYVFLDCDYNQIDSITNDLIDNPDFYSLSCNNNNITYFNLTEPFDGLGANGISADDNPLTKFDGLPAQASSLTCNGCLLDKWPDFQGTDFTMVGFSNTRLTEVGVIPDQMTSVFIDNNPNLRCIGGLPNTTFFEYDFSNTMIACVPFKVPACLYLGNPAMATIPECGVSNPNGCVLQSSILGQVYYDLNNNCQADANEPKGIGQKLNLVSNNVVIAQYITSSNGIYNFNGVPVGNYQVILDTTAIAMVSCPDSGYYSITATGAFQTGYDFGGACKPISDIGVASIVAPGGLRAGGDTPFYIALSGNGIAGSNACLPGSVAQVKVILSPFVTYAQPLISGIAPSSISGDTLLWNVANLGAIDFGTAFNFVGSISQIATLNDTACILVSVSFNGLETDTTNNSLYSCFPIRFSYDPNNKLVDPAGNIEPMQEWLTYTVNFQNTGNAPALEVFVLDTLPSYIDPFSVEVLHYSHDMALQVLPGGILRFNFPNINLPDSVSNEPESHGFVVFKAKLLPNLPIGTTINNRVGIYFDLNAVVMTDYATNTIAIPLPTITAQPPTICEGDTSVLSAVFSDNYTYEWQLNGTSLSPVSALDTLAVVDTGSYTLKVIYPGDFAISHPYHLAFHSPTPLTLAPSSNTVCENDAPIAITLSPVGGTLTGTGISGTDFNPAVAGSGNFAVTYTYLDANGCTSQETASITVIAKPTATLTTTTNAVCEDATAIALTATPSGGTFSGAVVSGNSFNPANNNIGQNTILYTYTDANGCTDTATSRITINAKPIAALTATTNAVCEAGAAIALTASPSGGTFSGALVSGNTFNPADNTTGLNTIVYTYNDANGCADTATASITVNAKPTATLTATTNAVCEDASAITLTASPSGGSYSGAVISGNSFNPADNTTGPNTIVYVYTDANGCADTAMASITVYALTEPAFSLPNTPFCQAFANENLLDYVNLVGGTFSGDVVTINGVFDLSAIGNFAVAYTYIDGNGCEATAQATVVVDECIGIGEVAGPEFNLYPNPASTQLTLTSNGNLNSANISIFDLAGRQVYTQQMNGSNNSYNISIEQLSIGLYMLIVKDENQNTVLRTRFVVSK